MLDGTVLILFVISCFKFGRDFCFIGLSIYPVSDSGSLLKILLMSMIVAAGPGRIGSRYPAPDRFDHYV